LFRLFLFYTETASFDVSIELKQTEDQPKQFDREHSLVFFSENLGFFRFVSVCFGLFRNSLFRLFRFFTETESFNVSMEPKQTEDQPNSLIESIFCYFSENLGLFWFVSKQFCLFQLFRYRFETPKQTEIFSFWFYKTNRNTSETDLFRFEPNFFLVSRTPYLRSPFCKHKCFGEHCCRTNGVRRIRNFFLFASK
jgi:hypothetical protein